MHDNQVSFPEQVVEHASLKAGFPILANTHEELSSDNGILTCLGISMIP